MDLALYGLTVQEAQAFEAVLARAQYESAARAHADGALPPEEREQLAKDAVKTVQRASGSSLSRKLRGEVDADLLREVGRARRVAQLPRAPLPAQPLAVVERGPPAAQTARAALQTRMRAPVRGDRAARAAGPSRHAPRASARRRDRGRCPARFGPARAVARGGRARLARRAGAPPESHGGCSGRADRASRARRRWLRRATRVGRCACITAKGRDGPCGSCGRWRRWASRTS